MSRYTQELLAPIEGVIECGADIGGQFVYGFDEQTSVFFWQLFNRDGSYADGADVTHQELLRLCSKYIPADTQVNEPSVRERLEKLSKGASI